MAVLVRTQGTHQTKWVYPVRDRCTLGRHAECDVSDIFADNSSASRFHAVVGSVGGRHHVKKKTSRNGTFVNGQRVIGRAPLRSGDRPGIGGIELTFLEEAEAAVPRVLPAAVAPAWVDFIDRGWAHAESFPLREAAARTFHKPKVRCLSEAKDSPWHGW